MWTAQTLGCLGMETTLAYMTLHFYPRFVRMLRSNGTALMILQIWVYFNDRYQTYKYDLDQEENKVCLTSQNTACVANAVMVLYISYTGSLRHRKVGACGANL